MQIKMFMKEIGLKIKLKDLDNIYTLLGLDLLVIGKWISRMGKELKFDLMDLLIQEIINRGKNKVLEYFIFLMEVFIEDSFKIMKLMDLEFIIELMEELMRESD